MIAHFFSPGPSRGGTETKQNKKKPQRLEVFDNSVGTTATASMGNQLDLRINKELETHKTIPEIPIPSPHI